MPMSPKSRERIKEVRSLAQQYPHDKSRAIDWILNSKDIKTEAQLPWTEVKLYNFMAEKGIKYRQSISAQKIIEENRPESMRLL